jgi:hypothetical protein
VPPLAAGEVRDIGEIRLDGGRDLRGRILGSDDKPVAGALVQAVEPWAEEAPRLVTRSDEDGGFLLFRMPNAPFRVRVDAAGYPPHFFLVDDPPELRLTAGGFAEGPGSALLWPMLINDWAYASIEAPADERGFFRVRLQPGRYKGCSEDKGGTSHDIAPFVVEEGRTTRVELRPQ